eukprot:TRINITY_DN213_c0_g1_i1.p2 TRINITY_DN213_c0_g1~~TRINITY_DN213_c0_g1_i1.p2  ORF type:complete len:111 (-),score=16.76 TRINITY_DN213_c0_g1_i1:36-368(-)
MSDDTEDVEVAPDNRSKSQKQESAALANLSGYGDDSELNASKAVANLKKFDNAKSKARDAEIRELAKVKVDDADINLLVEEFEIERSKAEHTLRKCQGDVTAAMQQLVNE